MLFVLTDDVFTLKVNKTQSLRSLYPPIDITLMVIYTESDLLGL